MLKHTLWFIVIVFLWKGALFSQTDTTAEAISISAKIADSSIPLNRILSFIITVEWKGSADRYTIASLENPTVTNFTITSSSASNRVDYRNGEQYTVKVYEFGLKPVEVGMGYIENVILSYTKGDSGTTQRAMTQRIAAQITAPVPEPENRWRWLLGAGGFVVVIIIIGIVFYQQRQKAKKIYAEQQVPKIPREEHYIQELKNAHASVVDFRDGLGNLTRLLNQYLLERFGLSFSSFTGEELTDQLMQQGIDEKQATQIGDILKKSDIYKFSGQPVDRGTYELLYADIMAVIEWEQTKLNEDGDKKIDTKATSK